MTNQPGALFLSELETKWIVEGYKTALIRDDLLNSVSTPIPLISNSHVMGLVKLADPKLLEAKDFRHLFDIHRVTDEERCKRWPNHSDLLIYKIQKFEKFDEPTPIFQDGARVLLTVKDNQVYKQRITSKPWDEDKDRFSIEQSVRSVPRAVLAWAKSRAKQEKRNLLKSDLQLPYKEPNGAINLRGVKAALDAIGGARGGVDLPNSVKDAARLELNGILSQVSKAKEMSGLEKISKKDTSIQIVKADGPEERTALGIVLEPETTDGQGDIYNEDVIRFAAHRFMENFQNMGLMHKEIRNEDVKILESFLAPADFEIEGTPIKKGTWLMRVRVISDALWKSIKTGGLTVFLR